MTQVLRVVSWNIALRKAALKALEGTDYDVALLQEAPLSKDSWERKHYSRCAKVAALSDRAAIVELRSVPLGSIPGSNEFVVSAPGTIAAAQVVPSEGTPFIVVSLYARWEKPHPCTPTNWGVGYSDSMAHRAISDLSAFIGHVDPSRHRILLAGDFNLIHGATDSNTLALPARDRSVFSRLEALGFEFLGPQYPHGRRADPPPAGLPADTENVPTYYTTRQRPQTAVNQLDYVFASRGFHRKIQTRALNEPEQWGPSDHCRIAINVEASA